MKITEEQARAAYAILVSTAGAKDDADSLYAFIWHVALCSKPADEYRFAGKLGSGGKFRNNLNRQTPYVDYYPEHHTDKRRLIAEETNTRLADLFQSATPS